MNSFYKLLIRLNYVAYVALDIWAWVSGGVVYGFILLIPLVLFPCAVSVAENVTISKADKFFLSEWDVFLKKLEWGNATVIGIVIVLVFLCSPERGDKKQIDVDAKQKNSHYTDVKNTSLKKESRTDYQLNTHQFKEEKSPLNPVDTDKKREENVTPKEKTTNLPKVTMPEQDLKKSDNTKRDDRKKKREARRKKKQ